MRFAAVVLALTACTGPELATRESNLTAAERRARFELIRDSAAEMGLYNAPLLAGIAISETNLAHCDSEASFGCPGPASPSCGGGAILAGGADGPCGDMQGGLGMFQFDAGTYAQTIATYGDSVLTIEGNTAHAVNFVVVRAKMDIAQAKDWLTAVGWMNEVPMEANAANMVEWADFIVCRYNGCCSTSSTCTSRRAGYRDNAIAAFTELGAEFWDTSNRCGTLPEDGVIDQRSGCYIAGGDPRYWRRVDAGYADTSEWTGTTSSAAPANFGRWIVKAGRATRYHVDVHLDGGVNGTATTAKYTVVHGGVTEIVMVDQTSASGFVTIGEFDFTGTGDEYIELGDNTGEVGTLDKHVMFDAIRVLPLDGEPTDDDGGGCCQTSRSGRGNVLLFVLVAFVLRSRSSSKRARRRARA